MMLLPYDRPRMKPLNRLIACLALDLIAGEEIQLLPDGEFTARDGRPGKGKSWHLDAAIAQRLIAQASTRATPYVVDYEHQTLRSATNGEPAPAAGWFKTLVYRPGSGLFATDVQWTDKARAMIAAGEYRFISPVFAYDQQGRVTQLLLAAITNVPALDELDEVTLKAAASLAIAHPEQEQDMNETLLKIAITLGLAASATEADVLAACTALKSKADEAGSEIAVLKTKIIDPTKYVPVEVVNELKTQVASLSTRINEGEVEELVKAAISEGKLATEAEQSYARTVGKADVAALRTYIAATPAIKALAGSQTKGKAPEKSGTEDALSAEQLAVCTQMGLDPVEYRKSLAA